MKIEPMKIEPKYLQDPPECRFCGAVYGHGEDCRSLMAAKVRQLEREQQEARAATRVWLVEEDDGDGVEQWTLVDVCVSSVVADQTLAVLLMSDQGGVARRTREVEVLQAPPRVVERWRIAQGRPVGAIFPSNDVPDHGANDLGPRWYESAEAALKAEGVL